MFIVFKLRQASTNLLFYKWLIWDQTPMKRNVFIKDISFSLQDDHNFIYLSENLRVPKNLYERIAEIADYKKYTSALLMILFDRETLATHSLQGRRNTFTGEDCHKPQLPPEILKSLIGKSRNMKDALETLAFF